jgi:CDP-diacylglycerol--glycerol-3-phosphate 3-phosphatidyltransferase
VLAGFAVSWVNSPAVFIFLALRLACANLDGALARAKALLKGEQPSRLGFTKNEIGDRLADFATLSGLVFLVAGSKALTVVLAVFVAAIPTVISLIGVTKGLARINGGPLGKTERALLVFLIVLLGQLTNNVEFYVYYGSIVIIIGSLLTAWIRYLKIIKA